MIWGLRREYYKTQADYKLNVIEADLELLSTEIKKMGV